MSNDIDRDSLNNTIQNQLQSYFAAHDGEMPSRGLHTRIIREVENVLISTTLEATGHNQVKAAEILGINRNTLKRKMNENGIQAKLRARRRSPQAKLLSKYDH